LSRKLKVRQTVVNQYAVPRVVHTCLQRPNTLVLY